MNATPVELREYMSKLLKQYRASWHTGEWQTAARAIVALFEDNRWLGDQIPNDILDMAYKDAK